VKNGRYAFVTLHGQLTNVSSERGIIVIQYKKTTMKLMQNEFGMEFYCNIRNNKKNCSI